MLIKRVRGAVALSVIAAGGIVAGFSAAAADGPQDTAALPMGVDANDARAALPKILPINDAARYRRIFKLQKAGQWRAANTLIDKLGDRLLMGHVLYQRYMHPTEYRSRYVELKKWMASYADHPGARGVYRLALRRKPGNWRAPQQPLGVSFGPLPPELDANVQAEKFSKTRYGTRKQRRHARYVTRQIKSLVRRGRPTQALKRLRRKDIRRGYHAVHYDQALAIIARGYYHANKDEKALRTGAPAIARSGVKAAMALWWSGLAAWRSGKFAHAAEHFERLARAAQFEEGVEHRGEQQSDERRHE